jgi:hypothetical protein
LALEALGLLKIMAQTALIQQVLDLLQLLAAAVLKVMRLEVKPPVLAALAAAADTTEQYLEAGHLGRVMLGGILAA